MIMNKIAHFIVKNKYLFASVFIIIACVFGYLMTKVEVNYDNSAYLPSNSQTSKGLIIMKDEFSIQGNVNAMIKNISVVEALSFKESILIIDGIANVIWVDDFLEKTIDSIYTSYNTYNELVYEQELSITKSDLLDYLIYFINLIPEEFEDFSMSDILLESRYQSDENYANFITFLDNSGFITNQNFNLLSEFKSMINEYYKDGNVLFVITFTEDDYSLATMNAIKEIKNSFNSIYLTGGAFLSYNNLNITTSETTTALIIAVIIILVILLALSTSFFEPVIFLLVIGVGILINMGSNIIFGSISYLTESVASILQLALTMDYSIFLLHRFKIERKNGLSPSEAMENALIKTFSPISASSLTTIASFIALMFMQYTIGFDIGIVLGKGVLISLLCVFFFMPAIIMMTYKLIEKTAHKGLRLQFGKFSEFLKKTRFVIPIIFLIIIIPAIYLSSQNQFVYGSESSSASSNSDYMIEKNEIESIFGTINQLVVLINNDDFTKELEISNQLISLDKITNVQSYALLYESGFIDNLQESYIDSLVGLNYNRIILNLNVNEEGDETTTLINEIQTIIENILNEDEDYYLIGNSSATIDIKNYIEDDYTTVTIISILLILIILAIAFRSVIIPIILILVIQSSIWVNMAIPYLFGDTIIFMGYLFVSAIQLGATIDYAILFTNHYIENRKKMDKINSIKTAFENSHQAIITSAGILGLSSLSAGLASSIVSVSSLCLMLAKGTLCSFILVFILLPQLIMIFDKCINKSKKNLKLISKKELKLEKK